MNAYLTLTTFWGTTASLLGASTPNELGPDGAPALSAVAIVLGVLGVLGLLGVATRALERRRETRRQEAKKETRQRLEREERDAFCVSYLKKNGGNCVLYATAAVDDERVGRNERRVAEKRTNGGARRRQAETRRRVGLRVAFWAIVASGFASAAFLTPPENAQKDGSADVSTVAEQTNEDAERAWDAPNVKILAVADAEGSRWTNASAFQDVENELMDATGQVAQKKATAENKTTGKDAKNSENKTSATNAAEDKRAILACRAVSETVVDAPEKRRVRTSSGELKSVEQIRAVSSLEVEPASSSNSNAARDGETNVRVSTENVAWKGRRVDAWGQTAAQNGQVASFAQSAQNGQVSPFAQPAQNGQVSPFAQSAQNGQVSPFAQLAQNGQVSQFAQPAQDLSSAQNGQVASFAQSAQNGQVSQFAQSAQNGQISQFAQPAQNGQVSPFAQPAQNLASAQNGRVASFAQPAQNLASTQRRQGTAARDAVVASAYDERRGVRTQSELAREFTPTNPLIPFPSEERVPEISSVSYEARGFQEAPSLLEQIDAESQRVGERVRKSVLSIETTKAAKTKSAKNTVETGCGFLFQYKNKMYLATNTHVVKDATSNKNVKLFLPDQSAIHPTKIMTCGEFDLAALEIDETTLPTDGSVALCYFGDSDELRVSNFVGTIGNPFGLRDTVTCGHVSSLQRRKNEFTSDGEESLLEFIQIDASINPGNSGGPLYNARGEVVGVVAAIATTTGKSEGVAFAIPINLALNVLKATIDGGGWSRSRMGVKLKAASRADFQGVVDWPIKSGSKIVSVNANSPAERAGLRDGDVVVEFNGEAIEDDVHFARLIAIADVSREANVKFLRGAKLMETSARLERSDLK